MSNPLGPEIWKQIPLMTKMAVGAREPMLVNDGGLEFKAGRSLRVRIMLMPSDTYTVECYRLKRGTYEKVVIKSYEDVYADNLGEVVYAATHNK